MKLGLIMPVYNEGATSGESVVRFVAAVGAVGGLLLDQVYIAARRESRLPAVWLTAVATAGLLIIVLPGTPTMRVATAFTVAMATAVAALAVPVLLWRQQR